MKKRKKKRYHTLKQFFLSFHCSKQTNNNKKKNVRNYKAHDDYHHKLKSQVCVQFFLVFRVVIYVFA